MELLVLGAGPAYTNRKGAASAAFLVSSGASRILLDLGQGAFPNLAAAIEPSTLDGVIVSHLHPDHFVDLVPLRHYLRYEFRPPRHIAVHAPGALMTRLDGLVGEDGFAAATLDAEPLHVGRHRVGAFTVEARRVTHTDESYAVRVSSTDDSPGLVYSGDCGRSDELLPLIRHSDTLLAEVSFGPGPVPPDALHLDAPSVARVAATAGARRLLLTHLQMGFDPDSTLASARERFDGEVRLVFEGETFSI